MANRFDAYVRNDYVREPLDYMQLAMQNDEQQYGGQLQGLLTNIDATNNIQAAFRNDQKLKQDLINGIRKQVDELSKTKLDSPTTLQKLSGIVNDKDTVGKLAAIQANAIQKARVVKEMQDYEKETGNSINNTRIKAMMEDYDKSDGFRANFLNGVSPGKYIDIAKDVREVLSKIKGKHTITTDPSGRWIVETETTKLPLEQLMKEAGIQMNDPKYQRQLQDLMFDRAYNAGGGDLNKGYQSYANRTLGTLDNHLKSLHKELDLIPNNDSKKNQAQRKLVMDEIKQVSSQRRNLETADPYQMFAGSFMDDLAQEAARPLVIDDFSQKIKANPYELENLRHKNALARQRERMSQMKQLIDPVQDVPVTLTSGVMTTNQILANSAFAKSFGDLELDGNGIPKTTLTAGETVAKAAHAGTTAIGTLAGGLLAPLLGKDILNQALAPNDATLALQKKNKWMDFAKYAREHGRAVDMKKIEASDPAELRKLGSMYTQMKAATANDTNVGFAIDMNQGTDPVKVGGLAYGIINAAGGQGLNANNEKVNFTQQLNELVQAGKIKNFNEADLKMQNIPGSQRVLITYPGMEPMFFNPPQELQGLNKSISDLSNPEGKIGNSVVSLPGGPQEFYSYKTFDKDYQPVTALMRPRYYSGGKGQIYTKVNAEDAISEINHSLGVRIKGEAFKNMEEGDVFVYYKNMDDGQVHYTRYSTFINSKEFERARAGDKPWPTQYVIKQRDNTAAKKEYFRLLDPAEYGLDVPTLAKDGTKALLMTGGPLSNLPKGNGLNVNQLKNFQNDGAQLSDATKLALIDEDDDE